jgi:membrane protease YdiL (CAAX protease family)
VAAGNSGLGVLDWAPAGERGAGAAQRLVEVTAVVALWIGIGELTDAGIQAYLLIGIPLTAPFQLWVRRRPIRELWVRGTRQPGMIRRTLFRVLALLFVVYPIYALVKVIADAPAGEAAQILYFIAAAAGAAAAAYAFTHFTRETWRYVGLCVATAGLLGSLAFLLHDVRTLTHPTGDHPTGDLWLGVFSFIQYIPVVFVMEEVSFRGAFDSHAHHEGDRRGILTAIYVSCLWGAWHAPVIGWEHIVSLVVYQGVVGTFLSIYWRKSGNLGVSGSTHALIDAIRNASGYAP